jgi:hypothetical protein
MWLSVVDLSFVVSLAVLVATKQPHHPLPPLFPSPTAKLQPQNRGSKEGRERTVELEPIEEGAPVVARHEGVGCLGGRRGSEDGEGSGAEKGEGKHRRVGLH